LIVSGVLRLIIRGAYRVGVVVAVVEGIGEGELGLAVGNYTVVVVVAAGSAAN